MEVEPGARTKKYGGRLRFVAALTGAVIAAALLGMELPSRWPERILVDSKEFRIVNGIKAGMSFHVFVAASYEWNRAQRKPFPIVWRMATYPHKTKACWEEFFLSLQGTPGILVSDMDQAIRKAAAAVFPRKGDPTPDIRMCEYHLKQRLEIALAPIRGQPNHPLWAALEDAFFSPADWAAFEQLVWATDAAGHPPLKVMTKWLGRSGHEVAAQVHTRPRYGPHSIGPVEATLKKIDAAFLDRSSSFGNRTRMNLLLGLMTLSMQGKADERVWAEHIRRVLHPVGGYAPGQRPHDDPAGWPSLVA